MAKAIEPEICARARVVRSEPLLAIRDFAAIAAGRNHVARTVTWSVGIAGRITTVVVAVGLRGDDGTAHDCPRDAQAEAHATKSAPSIAAAVPAAPTAPILYGLDRRRSR